MKDDYNQEYLFTKPSTSNKARLLYEKLKQLKKEREETEGIAALLKLNRGRIT